MRQPGHDERDRAVGRRRNLLRVKAGRIAGLLGMAGLALIVPLFIPSRWCRRPRVPGYAAPGEGTLAHPAAVAPVPGERDGAGGQDQEPGPVLPPGGTQPPWGPADQA